MDILLVLLVSISMVFLAFLLGRQEILSRFGRFMWQWLNWINDFDNELIGIALAIVVGVVLVFVLLADFLGVLPLPPPPMER